MKLDWRTDLPQWLLLAAMFALALVSWNTLPDRLPTHFGLNGEPDGWGGKFEALLLFPLVAVGVYLLMAFLPRLDPGGPNYARFQGPYTVIRITAIAAIAVIYGVMHLAFRSGNPALGRALPLVLGALFIVLGNQMGKIRPNWFVGVRTPWTLSSKQAWVKTHRLAGWVMVVTGILSLVAGAIGRQELVVASLIAGAAGILGAAVYSYFVWRSDPDKLPPAGTLPADGAGGDVSPRA